jgi:hypothetical protein
MTFPAVFEVHSKTNSLRQRKGKKQHQEVPVNKERLGTLPQRHSKVDKK